MIPTAESTCFSAPLSMVFTEQQDFKDIFANMIGKILIYLNFNIVHQ